MLDSKNRIHGYHGGLGDALQFSTLPELSVKSGVECHVLKPAYFRSQQIKQFVWEMNPYITGESEGDWSLGDIKAYKDYGYSFISNWEIVNGFEPTNDYPFLGYQATPKPCDMLVDLTAITHPVPNAIDVLSKLISPKYSDYQITNEIGDLKDYADKVLGCKVFVSLNSGGHMLAAAMRRQGWTGKQYCILPKNIYDLYISDKHFIMPEVEYVTV